LSMKTSDGIKNAGDVYRFESYPTPDDIEEAKDFLRGTLFAGADGRYGDDTEYIEYEGAK